MSESAARVKAALTDGRAPLRRDVEASLREMWGCTRRQAKLFGKQGLGGLATDEFDEVQERLASLERTLKQGR